MVLRYLWNNLYLVGLPRLFLKHLGVTGLQHPHDMNGWSLVDVTSQGIGLLRNRKWRFIIWGLGHRKYQMTTPTQWLYSVNLKFLLKSGVCGILVFVILTKIRGRNNTTNWKIFMFSKWIIVRVTDARQHFGSNLARIWKFLLFKKNTTQAYELLGKYSPLFHVVTVKVQPMKAQLLQKGRW